MNRCRTLQGLALLITGMMACGGSPGTTADLGADVPWDGRDIPGEAGGDDGGAEAREETGPSEDSAGDVGIPEPVMAGVGKAAIDPDFEPYTDTNGNGRWDEGEPFEDLDEDGSLDTLWMGGFGVRQPTGRHDPLEARTLVVRLHGQDFVFTALDTLGFGMKRVDQVRTAVTAALGDRAPAPERIFIASIHTHQAPDTVGVFAPDTQPGWDETYLQHVVDGAVASIVEAYDDLRPARLRVARADGEGLARDIVPPVVLDPYIGILQAVDPSTGAAIATMMTIANHPEAAWGANTLLSADYPHYLRDAVEADLGGMALYFSADLGLMQTPSEIEEAGFDRARHVGEEYATRVLAALQGAPVLAPEEVVPTFRFARVPTPLQNFGLAMAVRGGIADGYDDYLYETFDDGPCSSASGSFGCVDLPIPVLRLGDRTTILCLPAEVTPELVIGGILAPDTYPSWYPDAPPEPVLTESLRTEDRFLIGLCGGDVGYLYPKVTTNLDANFDQQNGPGPDAAGTYLAGVARVLDQVNDAAEGIPPMPRLRAEGTRIVDPEGREVRLRGLNLGGLFFHETWITLTGRTSHDLLLEKARELGVEEAVMAVMRQVGPRYGSDPAVIHVCPGSGPEWEALVRGPLATAVGQETADALMASLQQEPPLCDDADLSLRRVLADRFGTEGRDALLDAFQQAWITEEDIAWIAAQGFNVVRIPIGYRSLVRGPNVEAPTGLDWNPQALWRLDRLLRWCARHRVWAVVDIQEAPGGQNLYTGTSGLFQNPAMQALTVQMWEFLSDRLRDRPEVAAYSLLAEPYGAPDAAARDQMYDRILKAIRARGDDTLCVIHDGFRGMDTLPVASEKGWTNVVYSTHLFEWTTTDLDGYRFLFDYVYGPQFQQAQEAQGVPYYIGSFSTFRNEDWAYEAAALVVDWMEQRGDSWSLWTYKRLDDPVTREVFGLSTAWGLRGRLQGAFDRPDPYRDDRGTLEARFRAYRGLDIAPNDRLLQVLTAPMAPR
ncbi:MAG TPA: cellulase family glycosylhydrolase [Myxococcota bacterium]|nr:cellulase family glycosylhydrolase [Myxococcota bacterium]HQK51312.1 cellulase family glycosylhydrolase [Myxococcota bacterium]